MRKKTIWGNYIKNDGVLYALSALKRLPGEADAYAAVIDFLPGTKELYAEDDDPPVCLSGAGFKWLMYLPMCENWCLTAFYGSEGKLLEWYFDISRGNFVDEGGVPCTDDLYLDLVLLPDGRSVTLDADELEAALAQGAIGPEDYRTAYRIRDDILNGEWNDVSMLTELCAELLSLFP
ncbi:MAG: DUF402 domain-containing protein [Clostridiaceae bacterium]|nr:DUF402 domain-containing protein [Eubacteriales bacterium]